MQGVMPRASVLGRPRYLRMLAEVKRFHRHARAVLARPAADRLTLEQFLADGGYSRLLHRPLHAAADRRRLVVVADHHPRRSRPAT